MATHRIPIHGGQGGFEGVANYVRLAPNRTSLEPDALPARIQRSRFLTATGYPVTDGASFIMVLEYTDAGPQAQAFLTYSQSGDSSSRHFSDQTERFSSKQWRPIRFEHNEILADPELEVVTVRGGAR